MFDFGKRNITNMNYTRYLALPKAWIDAMRLEKGDQVKIEMDAENRLILSAVRNEKTTTGAIVPTSTPVMDAHRTREGADVNGCGT